MSKRKGQTTTVEYAIILLLVAAVIIAMTTYVRRALQGRVRDVSVMAVTRAAKTIDTNMLYEYEPYYLQTSSNTDRKVNKAEQVSGTGGFITSMNATTGAQSASNQAAPADQ